MSPDKIDVWNDERIQRRIAMVNGRSYGRCTILSIQGKAYLILAGYLYGKPNGPVRATLFLMSDTEQTCHIKANRIRYTGSRIST
jgi:hypothetical protein